MLLNCLADFAGAVDVRSVVGKPIHRTPFLKCERSFADVDRRSSPCLYSCGCLLPSSRPCLPRLRCPASNVVDKQNPLSAVSLPGATTTRLCASSLSLRRALVCNRTLRGQQPPPHRHRCVYVCGCARARCLCVCVLSVSCTRCVSVVSSACAWFLVCLSVSEHEKSTAESHRLLSCRRERDFSAERFEPRGKSWHPLVKRSSNELGMYNRLLCVEPRGLRMNGCQPRRHCHRTPRTPPGCCIVHVSYIKK